jgi:hypothetical protein
MIPSVQSKQREGIKNGEQSSKLMVYTLLSGECQGFPDFDRAVINTKGLVFVGKGEV